MRFSIVLPDETGETVRARAAEAGISQTEWARRLVLAGCDGRAPLDTPSEVRRLEDEIADAGARIASLTAAIAAAEAEAVRHRDEATAARLELETMTADRDRLAERVQALEEDRHALEVRTVRAEVELERARTEAAAARETAAIVVAEKDARIDDLRRTLATLEGQLAAMTTIANRAIPETTGTGRRPWWRFWGPSE